MVEIIELKQATPTKRIHPRDLKKNVLYAVCGLGNWHSDYQGKTYLRVFAPCGATFGNHPDTGLWKELKSWIDSEFVGYLEVREVTQITIETKPID